jgi:NHLM bacteriocin system ABC transporter ATP-binding protein
MTEAGTRRDATHTFFLRIVSSSLEELVGSRVAVEAPLVVGREAACDLALEDSSVSRRHVRVEPGPDGIRVVDLDSGNGVWVGPERIKDRVIPAGGEFRVGSTIFTCDAPAAGDSTADSAWPADEPVVVRIVEGGEKDPVGREFVLKPGVTSIGRSAECAIRLHEHDISRQHAQLDVGRDGVRVTDLGSSCGLWVGTREVTTAQLDPGQSFRLGAKIVLRCDPQTAGAAEVGDPDATRYVSVSAIDDTAEPAAVDDVRPRPGPDETVSDQDFGRTVVMPVPDFLRKGTWSLEREGEVVEASAHRPFQLDDPDAAWYVVSGGLLIFTVALEKGEPVGTRTHFLGIVPGQLCLGFDLKRYGVGSSFLAVAKQGTVLRKIPRARLEEMAGDPRRGPTIAGLVDAWISGLSAALVVNHDSKRSEESLLRPGERLDLDEKGRATSSAGVLWIDVWSGSVMFDDMTTPRFPRRGVLFPVTPDSWIRSVSDEFGALALTPVSTADVIGQPELWQGVDVFHEVLCECEFISKKLAVADEYVRLQQKARHSEAAQEAAYDAIGSVLSSEGSTPEEFRASAEAEPVLLACQLVARTLGLEAKAHPSNEEGLTYEEQVGAVASVSGFRTRVVALRDGWERQDNGPLLGQMADTKDPVALVPDGPQSYTCVNPKAKTRTPVDRQVAEALSPFGYAFYRQFPEGLLRVSDVVKWGALGLRHDLMWVLALAVVVGIFGTVTPFITGRVFDEAIPQAGRGQLVGFGVALFVAALATSAFKFTQGVATVRIQARMANSIQSAVWDRILNLPVNFFRKYSAGDLADRADGVGAIQELVSGAGVAAILGSVSGLFYVVQMFSFNLNLALLAILLTFIFVGVNMTANYLQLRYQRIELRMRGRITGLVLNLLTGVTKIRVCGAESHAFRVWAEQFAQQRRIAFTVGTIQNVATVFTRVYPVISSIAIFATMISIQRSAVPGAPTLTTGDFIAFNAAYSLFLMAMQALGDASLNLLRVVPIYERLSPILMTESEVDSSKAFPGKLTGRIELSHVYFRYDPDGPWIIKDVSLVIEPGEFAAFVGSSGGGKSTLMRLMLGFEQPTRGSVLYDGQELNALDLRMVRQQLGVVLQTSRVMPTEIYRNIIGVTSRTIEDAWEAAEHAGLADDIRNMPMGMHTYVSEGGGTLSGGQRQRMMIARAVVNKPKVLFLDEATSALDNRAQNIVTESMDRMDATRIVIAHRLSTIINADRIYYLHAGSIAESGSHQELMEQDGLFAALAKRQMA